jgi:hypothetical protein
MNTKQRCKSEQLMREYAAKKVFLAGKTRYIGMAAQHSVLKRLFIFPTAQYF